MSSGLLAPPAAESISLEDVDISQELLARPICTPNRKGEISAMYALAGTLSQGLFPALKQLSTLAIEFCQADSAGVSVLEPTDNGEVFRWHALAGAIEKYEGGSTPRDWSPCGESLKAGRATLYSHPERYFTYFQQLPVPIVEGLVIPMYSDRGAVGTIWVITHTPKRRFDAEHVRILASLGSFAASALRMTPGAKGNQQAEAQGFAAKPKVEREMVWVEFVKRVACGDELALESLFQETRALVFSTALRILSFRVDAEEIAADVYARVWKNAASFDAQRGTVGAWLTSMARSGAVDRLRASAVRRRSEAALLFQSNSGEEPEAALHASQTRERLQRALQAVPLEQRQALELFYFSELSLADIAAKLGNPIGTVKTRLRLGLMKLRRLLAALEHPGLERRYAVNDTEMGLVESRPSRRAKPDSGQAMPLSAA